MSSVPSLRSQLLSRLLPVLLGAVLLSGALSYVVAQHYVNRVFDRVLVDTLNGIASRVLTKNQRLVFDFPEAAQKIFEWDIDDAAYFRVESRAMGHMAGQTDLEISLPAMTSEISPTIVKDSVYRQRRIRVAHKILIPSGMNDRIRVVVAETTISRDLMTQEIALTVLAAQLILIGLTVVVVWRTMRRTVESISEAASDLEQRTHHSQTPLDDSQIPQEIRPLTTALNSLLERLSQALTLQRQFVADAAHQLRTPLTALRLHLENAQSARTIEEIEPVLRQVRIAADRAIRLTQQLLLLAESEERLLRGNRDVFNLTALLREMAELWRPQMMRAGMTMVMSFTEPREDTYALGSRDLLVQVLDNLMDNALRYCPKGSTVQLHAQHLADRVVVTLEDNGPGISPSERPLVIRRFYRGDQTPLLDGQHIAGSGLGLAIAHEIMTRLGGELLITDSADGKGTRIELRMLAGRA